MASNLEAIAPNLSSDVLQLKSHGCQTFLAMASNLKAMAPNLSSDGLQLNSDGRKTF